MDWVIAGPEVGDTWRMQHLQTVFKLSIALNVMMLNASCKVAGARYFCKREWHRNVNIGCRNPVISYSVILSAILINGFIFLRNFSSPVSILTSQLSRCCWTTKTYSGEV